MISLTGLRSFVAVVETGGVRAAADQIHRTPSAVSMTLKQLELDIGAPLFESERKSTLSNVGRVVLEEARGMLAHYERACAAMTTFAADRLGRCDIASVPSVAVTLLPRAIARVRQAEGLFDIHVRDIDSSAIVDAVENGVVEVGLCVLANKRPELTFEALFREPLDFVCRVDHPLTKKKGAAEMGAARRLRPYSEWQRLRARPAGSLKARRQFETDRQQRQFEPRHGRGRSRRDNSPPPVPLAMQRPASLPAARRRRRQPHGGLDRARRAAPCSRRRRNFSTASAN